MASTVPTGARIGLTAPRESILATTHQYDAHAIITRHTDQRSGPLSWLHLSDLTSSWELAVLAVLFVLLSGLIVLRLLAVASDRGYTRPSSPLQSNSETDTDTESGDSAESVEQPHTHRSEPTDHQGYEHYLSPETPTELLSDEGTVVTLLVANHGRIRQHQITDETGWSKSKVSRICSQMHADGTIEKRSIGRENVIALSDTHPPADDSGEPTQSDDPENPVA